jgi:hypothetical protein
MKEARGEPQVYRARCLSSAGARWKAASVAKEMATARPLGSEACGKRCSRKGLRGCLDR